MGMDEKVLCVPTDVLWQDGETCRRINDLPRLAEAIEDHAVLIERSICETDESLQQIIPYIVIRRHGAIMMYDRGSKGGESRLSGKLSAGVGGHINQGDSDAAGSLRETIYRGMEREIDEETAGVSVGDYECVAMIREIDSDVGRVHTGIVIVINNDFPSDPASHSECQYAWVYPSMIIDHPRLETWSKMALSLIFNL